MTKRMYLFLKKNSEKLAALEGEIKKDFIQYCLFNSGFTIVQAALIFKKDTMTIRNWIKKGKLKSFKVENRVAITSESLYFMAFALNVKIPESLDFKKILDKMEEKNKIE